MTTLQEAARDALEALEHIQRCVGFATATIHQGSATWCQSDDAIEALRTALAQQDNTVTSLRSQVEYLEKIVEDQVKVLAQQGEQPTQRQLDTAMRQWETWKAYALELQAKLVKYEGGSPMLLNAAAPAPQAQSNQGGES